MRRPSSPRPQQCPPSQVGLHSTEVPAPQRHQLSSWVLQSAKGQEKLLGEHTPAPPRLCSSKQCQPFSHPAHRSQSCKAGLGCPWLPEPCCFAGGLRSLNPTPHVFSFTGKQDGTCIGLLHPCPSNTALAKLDHSAPRTQHPKGTNRVPGPCSLQRDRKHSSRSNTSPTAPLLKKVTQAVFAPRLPLDVGKSGDGLPRAPWPCCFAVGLWSLKPTPHVFSFAGKHDWVCEGLLRKYPNNESARGEERSSGSTHQPQRAKTQESYASRFRTQPPARSPAKRCWAAPGSLSPAALQGVFGA